MSDSSVSTKDSTKTAPVTMKMDPKGFYLYWINQSKVIDTLECGTVTARMQVEFLFAPPKHGLTVAMHDGGSHVWVTHMRA